MKPLVGVLALQGAFREHASVLRSLGADVVEVRLPGHLVGLDGLVLPGGESTTMGKLMDRFELAQPVKAFAEEKPVLATCAGLIMLAKEASGSIPGQTILGVLDVSVERNAYGRQVDSFEAEVQLLPPLGLRVDFPGVFIRAPRIAEVGPSATVVAVLDDEPVGVLQGRTLALSFHPELTSDRRIHSFFLSLILNQDRASCSRELSVTEV